MKLKTLISTTLVTFTMTACTTAPSSPQTPVVLEQKKNLSVEPDTRHNSARLIKQSSNCLIEFTGNFAQGKATEYWLFKNGELLSAFSQVEADSEQQRTVFNIQDPEKLKNFAALQNNFKAKNVEQCQSF